MKEKEKEKIIFGAQQLEDNQRKNLKVSEISLFHSQQ